MEKPKIISLLWTNPVSLYINLVIFLSLVSIPSLLNAETLVVTGQEQPGQDIGNSSYSLDSRAIEGLQIQQAVDLSSYLPNVDIKNSLGNTQPIITIRGVGLNDFFSNNDQSAGVYVDQVLLTSPAMMSFQLFDVERAQVLLGPQGNAYGRNATAGNINFSSKKPTGDFYADMSVGYGNYERFSTDAVINGGITDTLNGRLSMTGDWSSDGQFENTFTGNDYGELSRWAARGQLAWSPGKDNQFLLNVHGGHDNSDALTNWVAVGIFDLGVGAICAPALAGDLQQTLAQCTDVVGFQDRDNDPFTGAWDLEPEKESYQYGFSLITDWQFPNSRLTSVSAYEAFDQFLEEDADGSPAVGFHVEYDNFIEQFSQEIRLNSTEPFAMGVLPGNLNWTVGGYYHFDNRIGDPNQRFNFRDWFNDLLITSWDQDTQSAALFTHNEWRFTEQWQLVFGARYTWEEKDFFSRSTSTVAFGGVSGLTRRSTPLINSGNNRISDNALTGSVSIEYTPTDILLSYFKFSKGFKGGGFSGGFSGSSAQLNPYDKEELYAYELGFKTNLFNKTLGINTAFFYYDYRGMQVFAIPINAIIPVARLTNAEKATVLGMDASIIWQPIDELEINTNIGWLDHQIKDPRFNDLDLPNAPKLNFSNIIRYQYSLPNNLTLTPMLSASYQAETFKTVENKPLLKSDSYWLLNTSVSLQEGKRWELAMWANNLTDEVYITDAFDQSGQGIFIFSYGMPRTYGMTLSYRFD